MFKVNLTSSNSPKFCKYQVSFPKAIMYEQFPIPENVTIIDLLKIGSYIYLIDSNLNVNINQIIIANDKSATITHSKNLNNSFSLTKNDYSASAYDQKNDLLIIIASTNLFAYHNINKGDPTLKYSKLFILKHQPYDDIQSYDGFLFISTGVEGIDIYDFSQSNYPSYISTLNFEKLNITQIDPLKVNIVNVAFQQNTMFVIDSNSGVHIYNFISPRDYSKINFISLKGCKKIQLYETGIVIVGVDLKGENFVAEFYRLDVNDSTYSYSGPKISYENSEVFDLDVSKSHIAVAYANTFSIFYHSVDPDLQYDVSGYRYTTVIDNIKDFTFFEGKTPDNNQNATLIFLTTNSGYAIYGILDTFPIIFCNTSLLTLINETSITLDTTYYSVTCPQKEINHYFSINSSFAFTQTIFVNIVNPILENTNFTLIMGLSIGLTFTLIICLYARKYIRGIKKKYEHLPGEIGSIRSYPPLAENIPRNHSILELKPADSMKAGSNFEDGSSKKIGSKKKPRPAFLNLELIEDPYPIISPQKL